MARNHTCTQKGKISTPQNYRGIALTPVAAKVFNIKLLNRIRSHLEPLLHKNQNEFRLGRSTVARILTLRRLVEGTKAKHLTAVLTFVGFKKAFDSINRKKMLEILRAYGIPYTIVTAVGLLDKVTTAQVRSPNGETDYFTILAGVLQGNTLAPYLFIVALNYALRMATEWFEDLGFTLEERESSRYSAVMITDTDFADDIALISDNLEKAQKLLEQVESAASQVGLQINSTKTAFMMFGQIMATSMDWDELVWAWEGFRDAVGIPNKPLFARYVDIANEGARANGYDDLGDSWRSAYSDDLENQVYELYNAILPLYKQLHAYVRRRLNGVYGSEHVPLTGNLPANVLGDMWGRFWTNIYPHVVPYPDLPNIDVSDEMVRQNYTVDRIARMADEFFSSMGLFPVNDAFWENSMLERPDDGRDVVCHASAWDFYNRVDFRIKMCTEVNMEYFLILHHELGHIQYDMNYKHQPVSFRDGANIAFQEAIGEVMSQSVATPKHLKEVGLFDGEDDPIEGEYN
eukprot:XP_011669505.1 PREDICTED: angiotensin-converting enzyme-like [Strongylocentrotus purpuratus]